MPWNIAFPQSHATVKSNAENHTPRGFHIVMTYQAFDVKLPSVTLLTQWYAYAFNSTFRSTYSDYNYYEMTDPRIFTFEYLVIGQEHKFMATDIQIHITVNVLQCITIEVLSPILMTIYDGPGIKSPVIPFDPPGPNGTHIDLFSYQGFVTYSQSAILDEYPDAINYSHINALIWRWFSRRNELCFKPINSSDAPAGVWRSNRCHTDAGIHTIHQMVFTGYNMLSHIDNNNMYSGCQYGGFFSFNYGAVNEHIKICSNITNESTFPGVGEFTSIFITF